MKWTLILLSIFIMKTCNSSSVQKKEAMLSDTYNIITLNDKDVSKFNLTITFNDSTQQVSGFSGCNRFFGSFSHSGNKLTIGNLASTKMICNDTLNQIENETLKTLAKTSSILFTENGLSLLFKEKLLVTASKKISNNPQVTFEYHQQSRRGFQSIKINKKEVVVKNTLEGNKAGITCSDTDWENILKAFKAVNVEEIPKLKAPSQKRLYDGASIARLKITYNGKTYETPSFDHGNPPPYIANLVKEILSINNKVE